VRRYGLAFALDERGIISPLVIDQHGTILAGHRRWRAAGALALDTVPVIVRAIDNPLEAERIIIESNRQREKTASEVMREADHSGHIEREYARRRMLEGAAAGGHTAGKARPKSSDSPVANWPQGKGKTRDKVAQQSGMTTSTFRRVQTVWETANDETAPEPVRAVAQQQMAALDTKAATPYAAEKARKRMLAGKAADPVPHVAQGKGKTRDKVAESVGKKTASEVMREADNLTRIFAEEAKRRMLAGQTTGGKTAGRGRPKTDDSSCPTLDKSYPHRADDDVAQAIGLKRSTHRKVKTVYDTAHDEAAPAPIHSRPSASSSRAIGSATRRRAR